MTYIVRNEAGESMIKPDRPGATVSWSCEAEPWEFETAAGAQRAAAMHSDRAKVVPVTEWIVTRGETRTWIGPPANLHNLPRCA